MPYAAAMCRPLPVTEIVGRSRGLRPECPREEAVFGWWKEQCVKLLEALLGNWLLHFSGLDIQPTHPLVPPPSNPPIQPAIHLATQLSIRPATHSPIHPSTHPPIHPSSHPPNHFSTHDLRHTSMHRAFRRCIQPATHVAIQASSQPPNHPPTHVGVLGWMRSWWMGGCMGAWVCG